jgi:hypothetical protein
MLIIVFTGSQMPRHLISDAHEWINEIPTVPIYYLAKPQPRERAWQNQRGKKTLSYNTQRGLKGLKLQVRDFISTKVFCTGNVIIYDG